MGSAHHSENKFVKKFKNTQHIWSEASQKVHLESEFKQSIV